MFFPIRILLLLLFIQFSHSQYQNIKFERLTSYKGLSSILIKCIVQDDKGFMWFGTANGLYKYDGNKFTAFLHDTILPEWESEIRLPR